MAMPSVIDMSGKRFGRVVVLGLATPDSNRSARWYAQCDCGAEFVAHGTRLRIGKARSCGRCVSNAMPGRKFGRWTVVAESPQKRGHTRHNQWLCRCRCGVEKLVPSGDLRSGRSQSCGCLALDKRTTHGATSTREHRIWRGMLWRCSTTRNPHWGWYGARGIKVCDRWANDFAAFLADMGPCPSPAHSIDRIDNDGNYEPGNCRWATADQQCRNLRRNARLTWNGETLTVADWERRMGFPRTTIGARLRAGWTVERALTEPKRARKT